ncbi:MAG TPA: cadherin-like beta sandwich domain-containing protein [Patescibacteria group bacterium]|nr:cadherin-like beta sandwich domain-containing protein [Patescibacteria group bacterium]
MAYSRYSRIEDKKQRRRLLLAVVGSITIVALLVIFGVKLIVGFSILVENLKGSSPAPIPQSQALVLPPTLDPLPMATNSGELALTGMGKQGLTAIIYVNAVEVDRLTVAKNGTFSTPLSLQDGTNSISAKLTDNKGNTSDLSNFLTTLIKKSAPTLTINTPDDNATVTGDSNLVTVSGKTDDNTTVTINGRLAVVESDNSFSYQYPLNDGDNTLAITATDQAGNSTKTERKVTYHK